MVVALFMMLDTMCPPYPPRVSMAGSRPRQLDDFGKRINITDYKGRKGMICEGTKTLLWPKPVAKK